jgi:ribosomal protein L6P/L9E
MIVSKVFSNNYAINIKLMNFGGSAILLLFSPTKKILLKITSIGILNITHNSFLLLNNKNKHNDYYSLINTVGYFLKNNNLNYYSNFIRLHLVGLGFKNFVLNDELYILVGDCNYIIFKIPVNLKVYCKKNQIYVLGNNLTDI